MKVPTEDLEMFNQINSSSNQRPASFVPPYVEGVKMEKGKSTGMMNMEDFMDPNER